jgi:hypothetical protein
LTTAPAVDPSPEFDSPNTCASTVTTVAVITIPATHPSRNPAEVDRTGEQHQNHGDDGHRADGDAQRER